MVVYLYVYPVLLVAEVTIADVGEATEEFLQLCQHGGHFSLASSLWVEGVERWHDAVKLHAGEDIIGKTLVAVSEDFYRPTDVVNLWGDPTKARAELGWNPQSTTFEQLVELMVKSDMQKVAADAIREHVNLAEYLEKGVVK